MFKKLCPIHDTRIHCVLQGRTAARSPTRRRTGGVELALDPATTWAALATEKQ
jgi:hypothetical protein